MTNDPGLLLKRNARRAYELARLRRSIRCLFVLGPIVGIAAFLCSNFSLLAFFAITLSISTIALLWRGQAFGEGARFGLIAGATAFAIPSVFHVFGLCCKYDLEIATCVAAGVVAGGFLVTKASRMGPKSISFLISGGIVSTLTASLGCLSIGLGGVLALTAGVLAITIPVSFVLHLRTA